LQIRTSPLQTFSAYLEEQGKMKINIKFWHKLSNISTSTCGVAIIINLFFKDYVKNYISVLTLILIFTVILSLISEIMMYVIKNKK
jgi:hypothetical protein